MERASFLIGLFCLGTGSEDAEALSMYQTPPCISATVEAEPIMNYWFPPIEAKGIAYILWYRGTEKRFPSDKHFKRSENISAGSASLQIPRVQAEDAGVYICELGNITCILKGNGTKLKVHGAGQTPENQIAAEVCVHVTVPPEDEAVHSVLFFVRHLIGGLLFLALLLMVIMVHCLSGHNGGLEPPDLLEGSRLGKPMNCVSL